MDLWSHAKVCSVVRRRVYAVGVRAGRPGVFYLPIAALALLQLAIAQLEVGRSKRHEAPL